MVVLAIYQSAFISMHWLKKNLKTILVDSLIGFVVLILIAMGVVFVWVSTLQLPDLSSFNERRVAQSTKIYDRTGKVLLYDLHQDVKRTVVPFNDISNNVKNATVAIEDDQFYHHFGIDIRAIIRAVVSDIRTGSLGQGGSTITQQVVKNTLLQNEKHLTRKIKEAILAIKLERVMSKDEILDHYLNESPYGGTIYGVEEAAQAYFGKSAKDVDLREASYLAALPNAPTYLSPYGNHRDALDARANLVLKKMLKNNFINQDQYDKAMAEKVTFQPQAVTGIRAPHFVMYVREKLVEKYGEEALNDRGFRVITSLDWDLQKKAEEVVKKYALENTKKFNATNAGMVVEDPQNGDILVMVGSRDYFDKKINGNFNVTLAPRQPGSSIKPIVYASAFSKGYTPDTVVYDVKTQFSTTCKPSDFSNTLPCYSPENFDHNFVGPVNLRNALAQSMNIPAIKVLYLTGLKDAIKLAGDMGITTLNDPDRLGLTLVLGGGEVKLLEHTGAYGVFADEGVKADQRVILRVEDANGNVVDNFPAHSHRVLSRDVALKISDVLSDNNARAPLWGYNSPVYFPGRDVAIKSGSTNNLRDAWIMGYTPNLVVGVWAGNNDNSPMGGKFSGLIATPMWRAFMDYALPKFPKESFAEPPATDPNIKPILRGETVDTHSLIQNIQSGSSTLSIDSILNNMHSILYYVNKDDPTGAYPSNPASDPQYKNWEYGVQAWKVSHYGSIVSTSTPSQ